jgi:hypothetical protein
MILAKRQNIHAWVEKKRRSFFWERNITMSMVENTKQSHTTLKIQKMTIFPLDQKTLFSKCIAYCNKGSSD